MKVIRNSDRTAQAAFPADGVYWRQALEKTVSHSLGLNHIPPQTKKEFRNPAATIYEGLTFSTDGNYIYFVRREEAEESISVLYRASVLGGEPKVIIRDVDSPITFSPDGTHFAFLRQLHDSPKWDLVLAKADGAIEKSIFTGRLLKSDSYVPAWSPDGKTILIPIVQPSRNAIAGFSALDATPRKDQVVPDPL